MNERNRNTRPTVNTLASLAALGLIVACSQPVADDNTSTEALGSRPEQQDMSAATSSLAEAMPAESEASSQGADHSRDNKKEGLKRVAGMPAATGPSSPNPNLGSRPGQRLQNQFSPGSGPGQVAPPGTPQPKGKHGAWADQREADRESYDSVSENDFARCDAEPLSTFSIDVDTAAYSNIRRLLTDGHLPPTGAVRSEEMLNYFTYAYPEAPANQPFSTFTEVGPCPWNPEHRLVHIGLQGRKVALDKTPPRNLTFILDVSGSMSSANKLPLLKQAMTILVDQLGEKDRVAIVVYAGASGLALPSTSGDDKEKIKAAMRNLRAGGSTNGGAGIRLAYQTARDNFQPGAINRVILATDGDFNVGIADRSQLVELIEREREGGVFLTVLGLGSGNLQDSTMEQLADKGNGNYAYLDTVAEAKKVLGDQVGSTLITIAKDVKIQVEFNPRLVKGYRLIGYENRKMAAQDFADDKKDAGEIGAGHSVTALYEVVPAGAKTVLGKVTELKYTETRTLSTAADSTELMTLRLRYKQPMGKESKLIVQGIKDPGADAETTPEFDFAAGVAMFGMLLRHSKYKGTSSYLLAKELAQGGLGKDAHGYRAELLTLIDKAAALDRPAVGTK